VNSLPSPANPADSMLISYTAHKSVLLNAHTNTGIETVCRVVLGTYRIEYTRALINAIQEADPSHGTRQARERRTQRFQIKKNYSK
jgi:hypothetical protein